MRRADIVLVMGLAACATARIDVDVYKGPLANTDEVQVQQAIAMTIGAKPLLVQLRDELEAGARKGRFSADSRGLQPIERLRREEGYEPRYIALRMADGKPWFVDAGAERVNAVLHLYRDLDMADPLVAALRSESNEYQRLFARINSVAEERRRDAEVWDSVDPFIRDDAVRDALRGYLLLRDDDDVSPVRFRDANGLLREAIRVLDGSDGALGRIAVKLPAVRRGERPELRLSDLSMPESAGGDRQAKEPILSLGANVVYAFLAERDLWQKLAGSDAFKETLPRGVRDALIDRGVELAESFAASRASLRRMFDLAVQIAYRALVGEYGGQPDLYRARSALNLIAALIGSSSFRDGKLAVEDTFAGDLGAIAESIGPDAARIWPALNSIPLDRAAPPQEAAENTSTLLRAVADSADDSAAATLLAGIREFDRWARSPATVIDGHGEWSRQDVQIIADDALRQAVSAAKRHYGVVGGPTRVMEGAGISAVDASGLGNVVRDIPGGHGLDDGRLRDGLDQLIADYLERGRIDPAVDELHGLRNVLLSAIARFSEKLRVMSGFQGLLGDSGARQYVDVLSAIAMSLQSQVDSLQRASAVLSPDPQGDRLRLEARARAELHGWRSVGGEPSAPVDPDRPGEAVRQTIPRAPGSLDPGRPEEVLDELLARLRHMQIDATLGFGPGSDEVARIREAIELALEHRTGFAHLRPAAEFLRNSSPASSVQQEPLILTPRILGGAHPHRASERERELARQLDKQYWQNVNSVTVDGIGTTQYVIAKDDIGNWQVKSVSSDVSELMETLGGLASFGLGGGISPLAQIDAARIESLVAKAREGSLGSSDRDAIKAMRAREREVAFHSAALESHVGTAVTDSLKMIEDMRSWQALWA